MNEKRADLADGIVVTDMEQLEAGGNEAKTIGIKEQLFSKEQLLCAERFSGRSDILSVLLADDEMYSVSGAEKMIEKFMKGQVK